MTKQLTVYKASAGSGKTFTLAVEYISLLIENPQKYRNILAVTFTNKATEEMKERILSQLYGIWKGLPESDDYVMKVKEHLPDYPEKKIRERAGIALHLLIHHYHYFRIETIDSFFQSVLRNLAKELNLTANLHISLDDDQIEEQAVDEIIESFSPNDPMLLWLIQYIEETIDDDKGWNVITSLKKMGKNIFKDFYKKHSEAMGAAMQGSSFNQYVNMLHEVRKDAKNKMAKYAEQFFGILNEYGLTEDDFSSKKAGICGYFRKLQSNDFSKKNCIGKKFGNWMNDPTSWVTKTHKDKDRIISLVEERLLPLLRESESSRQKCWREYVSANVILEKINQVRLLHKIEEKVHELNQEVNRFLLSDTQQLLHSLMKETDTPFVFEKIGSQLSHVMIDEFQDTSNVQWDNFKVLLYETMSHAVTDDDNKLVNNLIVGDVKQSIYRWRNSDWQLLNGISEQFPKYGDVLKIEPLKKNYRSYTNIVKFNNHFFTKAAELEADSIETEYDYPAGAAALRSAYDEVEQEQKNPERKEGYVNIQLFEKDFTEQIMCEKIGERVDELLGRGIAQKDIAILVRNKKDHVPLIANYFMQTRKHVHIVSEEAFQLSSSLTISTLMDALRLLINKDSIISRENIKSTCEKIHATVDVDALFSDTQSFRHLSMIDLIEQLYDLLQLSRITDEGAYLSKFYDEVMKFSRDYGADIALFIKEWDENLKKKTIQTNGADGIQLITIHKSKGLEFPYLIIPFCDWSLEVGGSVWFTPTVEPFNRMPILPVAYSKTLMESVFKDDYLHEHLQNMVDNLNLLYVAFTRAKKCLFVLGRKRSERYRSSIIQKVLGEISKKMEDVSYNDHDECTIFEYGSMPDDGKENRHDEEDVKNVFTSEPVDVLLKRYSCHHKVEFRQSNKSKEFLSTDEDTQENTYIKMGNILHYLFSKIRTTDDIPQVLHELEQGGILYDEDISVERLQKMLNQRLNDPQVADWFSPRWTLYNECTILEEGKENKRPDRVMVCGDEVVVVDFKFGKYKDEYKRQVEEYKDLLVKMGYTYVKGYLWMVYNNKVVTV